MGYKLTFNSPVNSMIASVKPWIYFPGKLTIYKRIYTLVRFFQYLVRSVTIIWTLSLGTSRNTMEENVKKFLRIIFLRRLCSTPTFFRAAPCMALKAGETRHFPFKAVIL
jgi:hypothetical protein